LGEKVSRLHFVTNWKQKGATRECRSFLFHAYFALGNPSWAGFEPAKATADIG
jgi:hypothetical protein